MNKRTCIWKVGGLAVAMVAVVIWLFGCSRESIEDVMEGGTLSAPLISVVASSLDSFPTSTIITLADGSSYYIELDSPIPVAPSNEWCYIVTQLSGKSLSHWMLLIGCLVEESSGEDHIDGSSPPGVEGCDGSTGKIFCGVKWDAPFPGNRFCITLDGIYPPTVIEALVKAGTDHNTGLIAGPACEIIQHNDVEQGNGE